MNLIPKPPANIERSVPAAYHPGQVSPMGQLSRREQRAVSAQDEIGRVEIHGLLVSEEVERERVGVLTRLTVRAFEAQAVIEDTALRSEMRAVSLERQACEMEPGAIPQIVALRQAGSMQRQELMDAFTQGLVGRMRRAAEW